MSLRDHDVDTRGRHLKGVLDRTDDRHHLGSVLTHPLHPGTGVAEPGSVDRHLLLDNHLHLLLKEILREEHRAALGVCVGSAARPEDLRQPLLTHELVGEGLVLADQLRT